MEDKDGKKIKTMLAIQPDDIILCVALAMLHNFLYCVQVFCTIFFFITITKNLA